MQIKQEETGPDVKLEFQVYINLSTFIRLRNSLLNFLVFLSNRVLLSYKPLPYKKRVIRHFRIENHLFS